MSVLFADPEHGPRSQMAESLFRAVADASAFEVASAGTTPGADLTGVAEVLAERGVRFTPRGGPQMAKRPRLAT
jgi:protein-tyrosine-phosphatase